MPAPDSSSVWLVASNGRVFDSDGAFAVHDEVDWSETALAGIQAGDVVLLYGTTPISALTHECRVVTTGIPFDEVIDDREFWRDQDAFVGRSARSWMRLRLERTFSDTERRSLSLAALLEHGLRSAPQGRMKAPERVQELVAGLVDRSALPSDDAVAETSPADPVQVDGFRRAIAAGEFAVEDRTVLSKTRWSAQRAFAEAVKRNYGHRCAVTGVRTREFLVASHIVPWADDTSIRLDPSNGICLSTLVDRAFDTGYLSIDESRRVVVHDERLAYDPELHALLARYHGQELATPSADLPRPEYLARRRAPLEQQGSVAKRRTSMSDAATTVERAARPT